MDPQQQQQLPTSPGASARRPRTGSRTFSSHSARSGSIAPPTPSAQERFEKERRDSFLRGESKANPNAAILEPDPVTRQTAEKVTLEKIRDVKEAKDSYGNVITEPDQSNPTRSRWERPLDTIRSFERAIDGDYNRRSSAYRGPQNPPQSRRTSYYGPPSTSQNRPQGGGYYSQRPESFYDAYGSYQAPAPRQRFGRGISEGGMGRQYGGQGNAHHYPGPASGQYEQSSGSEGPWTGSTDPSSQNSSYERLHGLGKQPQGQDNVGDRAGGQYAIAEDTDSYGFPPRPPPKNAYGSQAPAPPAHDTPRRPIQLGGSSSGSNGYPQQQIPQQASGLPSMARPPAEKRQSWFGRRFSKAK